MRQPATTARPAPLLRSSSNPTGPSPRGCHTPPSRHTPAHHLGHELLSVPPQDPWGVLHAPSPPASLSHPLPPMRARLGRMGQVVPGPVAFFNTLIQWGAPCSPFLTLSSHSLLTRPGTGKGPAWETCERSLSQALGHLVPSLQPLGTQGGPGGSQDPSYHLPVLPSLQKRLPVSLVCPCTWGLG